MSGFGAPSREQYQLFKDVPAESVHMLNVIRFRLEASYADGRKTSGREAHAAYGRESGPYFKEAGGKIVWRGSFAFTAIGPQEGMWDDVFVAEYPSIDHFFGVLRNTGYREKAVMQRSRGRGFTPHQAEPGRAWRVFPGIMSEIRWAWRKTRLSPSLGEARVLESCF